MLLHFELEKDASDLWGFDADQEGIDILYTHGSKQMVIGDLEDLEQVGINDTFDIIVAGEIIEHLSNPGLFLDGIRRFMNRETRLLVTTVNAYCAMRFLWYGVRGRRGQNEFVHPDHVAYYSYSTLKLLLDRHGMHVENFLFYDVGNEHRPHNSRLMNVVNDICVRIAPQWAD